MLVLRCGVGVHYAYGTAKGLKTNMASPLVGGHAVKTDLPIGMLQERTAFRQGFQRMGTACFRGRAHDQTHIETKAGRPEIRSKNLRDQLSAGLKNTTATQTRIRERCRYCPKQHNYCVFGEAAWPFQPLRLRLQSSKSLKLRWQTIRCMHRKTDLCLAASVTCAHAVEHCGGSADLPRDGLQSSYQYKSQEYTESLMWHS